jgi:hypothetical protein
MKKWIWISAIFLVVLFANSKIASAEEKKATPSWADKVKLIGDLRFRYEEIDQQGKPHRNRARIRARIGLKAAINDDWDLYFRLATSENGDQVSTNQTLTGGFSKKPIWLDLAYFDYHPGQVKGLDVDGGKMKNPFYIVGKNQLIWDHDLTPEGLAITYMAPLETFQPFVNTGAFWIQERSTGKDSYLYGVQGGVKVKFGEGKGYVAAGAGYYAYDHAQGYQVFGTTANNSWGNSTIQNGSTALYASQFNLVEGFGEAGFTIGEVPISIFGDYVSNESAKNSKNKVGWLAGFSVGKYDKPLGLAFRYDYRELQKDAVLGAFCDSDFVGGGTDGKGSNLELDLGLFPNVWLDAIYFIDTKYIAPGETGKNYTRLELDINAKI